MTIGKKYAGLQVNSLLRCQC